MGQLQYTKVYTSKYEDVNPMGNRYYYESIFGDISKLKGSDMDYYALVDNLKSDAFPKLFIACGTEDFMLKEQNEQFHQYLVEKGIEHEYQTGPGGHDWVFWDTFIYKALEWLPLDEATTGVSSGNVSIESEGK